MKGNLSKLISTETQLAWHISERWPRRPNPVTSVAARAPCLTITSEAEELSVVINLFPSLIKVFVASPRLIAVEIIPDPRGFVKIR